MSFTSFLAALDFTLRGHRHKNVTTRDALRYPLGIRDLGLG